MNVDMYHVRQTMGGAIVSIIVPHGRSPEEVLGSELIQYGDLIPAKSFDINPGELRIGVDTDEAIRAIQEHGYHVQRNRLTPSSVAEDPR